MTFAWSRSAHRARTSDRRDGGTRTPPVAARRGGRAASAYPGRARRRVTAWGRVVDVGRLLPVLSAVNVVEGAMRLAAQSFLAVLPLLMTVAAFAPRGVQDLMVDSLSAILGVRGDTLAEVRHTFEATGTPRQTVGALGVLLALLSATAFTRALQAVCERCWSLPRAPVGAAAWRWIVWLVVWIGVLLFQAPLRSGFGTGVVVGLVLSMLSSVLMWWWAQHLLLGGRIGWRELVPGALLAGLGAVALSRFGALLMPTAMQRSLQEFGPLGPVFTFLSWLIAFFVVTVSGLVIGRWIAGSAWFAALQLPRVRPSGRPFRRPTSRPSGTDVSPAGTGPPGPPPRTPRSAG
ncbi:ribonuclease BN [Streptomyces sp. NPDC001606]